MSNSRNLNNGMALNDDDDDESFQETGGSREEYRGLGGAKGGFKKDNFPDRISFLTRSLVKNNVIR